MGASSTIEVARGNVYRKERKTELFNYVFKNNTEAISNIIHNYEAILNDDGATSVEFV